MAWIVNDESIKSGHEASERFFTMIDRALDSEEGVTVAFDCEGVNLSRVGSVELVSLYFDATVEHEGATFLVDLHREEGEESPFRVKRLEALKGLFESKQVVKVIHDCRMDSDALFHLEGIKLSYVHDTSCCHAVLTGSDDINLNDMLLYYGIEQNSARDKSVYQENPAFWATRPLTQKMIEWATSDVDKLMVVASKQRQDLEARGPDAVECTKLLSERYTKMVRDMKLQRNLAMQMPIGLFIGPKGSNIRRVQRNTGTMIYQDFQASSYNEKKWLVFYPNDGALEQAKRSMGYA